MLHNPYEGTTPSQRLAAAAHNERILRLKDASYAKRKRDAALADEDQAKKLEALWKQRQQSIPIASVKWFAAISDIKDAPSGTVSVSAIVKAACQYFDYSLDDFLTPGRFKEVVHARHIAMYLARSLTDKSLAEVGRRLGGLDHSTVLHGCRKIKRLIAKDWIVAYDVAHMEALI
jgi:chromosomal replication initiation ATPase DnaA